jgi:hypothetical protein
VRRALATIILLLFAGLTTVDLVACADGCEDMPGPVSISSSHSDAAQPPEACLLCLNSLSGMSIQPQVSPLVAVAATLPPHNDGLAVSPPRVIEHPPRFL